MENEITILTINDVDEVPRQKNWRMPSKDTIKKVKEALKI